MLVKLSLKVCGLIHRINGSVVNTDVISTKIVLSGFHTQFDSPFFLRIEKICLNILLGRVETLICLDQSIHKYIKFCRCFNIVILI